MKLFKRILLQVLGYFIMSSGIALILHGKQGAFPYDAISFYLAELIPVDFLTVGRASFIIGISWTILNFILIKNWRIFFSLIVVFSIGSFIDFFDLIVFKGFYPTTFFMNALISVVGLVIVCFAVGIVVLNKSLPAAPSEIALVYLSSKIKTGWVPKIIIEGGLAVIAVILGLIYGNLFQIGWFTILCAFGCGPMINFFRKILIKYIPEY
ncbi:hypothetical protein [Acholeplasma hippikon]|uniref:BCR, YitT family n=1 Tax=Acholeplasma hippikon TaxID=264636 RepID=A0A449BKZ2_9MOLU|nr:hypothetical protein [Acholeplasma hippikon]VEU83119.1 Uncharacterised protein [Acholeplasma hippikon]